MVTQGNNHKMDKSLQKKMTKKCEVAYTVVMEAIAFAKIERQGISLDKSYRTNVACSTFVDFSRSMQGSTKSEIL